MKAEIKKELDEAKLLMDNIVTDSTVPRNIRSVVLDAKTKVSSELDKAEMSVAVGTAIYVLEDIASDINMPSHTRTEIWTIISALEAIKEKIN